jgi:hypothetical protein
MKDEVKAKDRSLSEPAAAGESKCSIQTLALSRDGRNLDAQIRVVMHETDLHGAA